MPDIDLTDDIWDTFKVLSAEEKVLALELLCVGVAVIIEMCGNCNKEQFQYTIAAAAQKAEEGL